MRIRIEEASFSRFKYFEGAKFSKKCKNQVCWAEGKPEYEHKVIKNHNLITLEESMLRTVSEWFVKNYFCSSYEYFQYTGHAVNF